MKKIYFRSEKRGGGSTFSRCCEYSEEELGVSKRNRRDRTSLASILSLFGMELAHPESSAIHCLI